MSKKNKTIKNRTLTPYYPTNKVYTEDEYNSNDGMLTAIWGPGMWHYLHTMSFNYPVHPTAADKDNYRNFVLSLQNVLPCGKCRKNLVKNFKKLPLTMENMESRATFSKYIYDLHEVVNKMLGKNSKLTYEMVRERYEHFRSRCTNGKRKTVKSIGHKGCTEPIYGEKSKCILRIVPQTKKCETLEIDKQCIKYRDSTSTIQG
uniref:thiol oxidase n=1 Tax=viral metagenome TaxID=1070528 RepID=A0A6C0DST5_9ZZZZ